MKNLKRKFILLLSIFVIPFSSSLKAQDNNTDDKKFGNKKGEIGVRFMPTFSSFQMNTSSGGTVQGKVTLGYGVGGFVGFNFTSHVGIQAEVIYSSLTQEYNEQDVKRKINLRYVNIPLLLSLNTGKYKAVNLNVVGGPQLGIGVGSSITTSSNNDAAVNSEALLSVKKSDIGLAYGAGVDFGLNKRYTTRLGLGFRGVYGLFDISDKSKTASTSSYYVLDRTHLKTYAAYIGLSILF